MMWPMGIDACQVNCFGIVSILRPSVTGSPDALILATESLMPKLVKVSQVASWDCENIYVFDERVSGDECHWTELIVDEQMARDFTWERLTSKDTVSRTTSLIYSSGSTGSRKEVELSHNGMIAAVVQARVTSKSMRDSGLIYEGALATLCYMSLSQVVGQSAACINYPGLNLPIFIANRSDFTSVIGFISKLQLTSFLINPSFIVAMNKRPEMRERLKELSSLRFLEPICSPVDYGQCEEFTNRWSTISRRTLGALQIYGMTEYGRPLPPNLNADLHSPGWEAGRSSRIWKMRRAKLHYSPTWKLRLWPLTDMRS